MNPKESLARIAGAAILLGSFMTPIACGASPKTERPQFANPTATGELKHGQNEQEWGSLSALARINRLEQKSYPKNPNFDMQRELIKATSEFFCEQVPCVIKGSDLQGRVRLLENDEYLKTIERILGKGFRSQEEVLSEGVVVPIPPSIKRQDRQIFINTTKAGRDIKMLKSLLFQGYSQVNQSDEDVSFEPFTIQGASGKRVTINSISRLILQGVDNNNQAVVQDGTARAMTAYAMSIFNDRTPIVEINKDQDLSDASLFLKQLMNLAGISNQEFLSYYIGQRSIIEYLQRLGSINPSSKQSLIDGRTLFTVIALKANGAISDNNVVRKAIEDIIGRSLNGRII